MLRANQTVKPSLENAARRANISRAMTAAAISACVIGAYETIEKPYDPITTAQSQAAEVAKVLSGKMLKIAAQNQGNGTDVTQTSKTDAKQNDRAEWHFTNANNGALEEMYFTGKPNNRGSIIPSTISKLVISGNTTTVRLERNSNTWSEAINSNDDGETVVSPITSPQKVAILINEASKALGQIDGGNGPARSTLDVG